MQSMSCVMHVMVLQAAMVPMVPGTSLAQPDVGPAARIVSNQPRPPESNRPVTASAEDVLEDVRRARARRQALAPPPRREIRSAVNTVERSMAIQNELDQLEQLQAEGGRAAWCACNITVMHM